MRAVFERARALEPSIVLVDEIDALAPSRAFASQPHEVALVSQLLVLLDGLEGRGGVEVVATTNRLEAIDAAVRRPGRFDYHIEVPLPDEEGRRKILEMYLRKMKTSERNDLDAIAAATEGFSGAELAAFLREAGLRAIERGLAAKIPPGELLVEAADLHVSLETIRRKRA